MINNQFTLNEFTEFSTHLEHYFFTNYVAIVVDTDVACKCLSKKNISKKKKEKT